MKLLEDLCLAVSPSSKEGDAISIWNQFMGDQAKNPMISLQHFYTDKIGNSVWKYSGEGENKTKILISAHIDTVCGRVTKITDKGTLMFSQSAGICLKSLVSGNVIVYAGDKKIPGVVQKQALHLDTDRKKLGDWLDFRINIGARNKKEAEEFGVFPGALIIYRPEIETNFGNGYIRGTGLDDKGGVWIVAKVLEKLAGIGYDAKNYDLYFGAATQEETGLNGAKRMARNINPDISIDVDCTFADTELCGSEYKDLDINLGDGALIAYGPEKSERICTLFREQAKVNEIPAKTYTTRAGGTNTKSFQDFAGDCECGLLSFGLLSMHSSNEIVMKSDLESVVNLITNTITSGKL